MDCMTSYYPWIRPQFLAIVTSPTGAVSIDSINYTTKEMKQQYEFNVSIGASPRRRRSRSAPSTIARFNNTRAGASQAAERRSF